MTILTDSFAVPQLETKRRVWIYLPRDYASSKEKYPVLYMHDGQNVFDAATSYVGEWGVDEILDSLKAKVIVVAVDHGGQRRIPEYLPWANPRFPAGAFGDQYTDFLVKTLKPYIDSHYRTKADRENTSIAGSSMGGLISLYAALKYPDVYGSAGVFSPAFWIAPAIVDYVKQSSAPHPRLYFVSAEMETNPRDPQGNLQTNQAMVVDALRAAGFNDVVAYVRADGQHSEWFWRREFPAAYAWLFRQ